jgi:hypothetical protein
MWSQISCGKQTKSASTFSSYPEMLQWRVDQVAYQRQHVNALEVTRQYPVGAISRAKKSPSP